MIEKNQELEVEIVSYGSEGQGIARLDGFVIFVPLTIIGEVVKVHIIKVTKSYAVGKVVEIIKPSKNRVIPKCSVFGKCGGCSLQHINYDETLNIKKRIIEDAFVKIAGYSEIDIKGVIPSGSMYNYRNKSAFPLFVNDGKLEVCMYRNLSHNPVFVENCTISYDMINKSAEIFKNYANKSLNYKDLQGLRYFVVRVIEEKVLVTIVSDNPIKNITGLYYQLNEGLNLKEGCLGLFWCKKSKDNNVILEGTVKHLLGIRNINANIMGVKIEISPLSFFQVNYDVMQKIYNKVIDYINNKDVVVDAYSGAGLMSALIAKKAKEVYGIEIVEDATKNANSLKNINKITNLTNINGDMNIELPKLIQKINNIDVVVVDPPRKGLDEKVTQTILNVKPHRIIYVSCNPATLARDAKSFLNDYNLKEVVGYDMFPNTAHVETLALFERRV